MVACGSESEAPATLVMPQEQPTADHDWCKCIDPPIARLCIVRNSGAQSSLHTLTRLRGVQAADNLRHPATLHMVVAK
jgi:hypothetical protein